MRENVKYVEEETTEISSKKASEDPWPRPDHVKAAQRDRSVWQLSLIRLVML